MSPTKTFLINVGGDLWRFTRRQWTAFCRAGAAGDYPTPRAYGAKPLDAVAHATLDWDAEDYGREFVGLAPALAAEQRRALQLLARDDARSSRQLSEEFGGHPNVPRVVHVLRKLELLGYVKYHGAGSWEITSTGRIALERADAELAT